MDTKHTSTPLTETNEELITALKKLVQAAQQSDDFQTSQGNAVIEAQLLINRLLHGNAYRAMRKEGKE